MPASIDLEAYLKRVNPSAEIYQSIHRPRGLCALDNPGELIIPQSFKGKEVTLFSGIGDPASFENLVSNLGIKSALSFRFRDHHHYTQGDIDNICRDSKARGIDTVITTEKDACRLQGLTCSLSLLVLKITLEIKDEQRFLNRLYSLYSI
jgi:tetraacyldisaccharide-1-P 4'-kinase